MNVGDASAIFAGGFAAGAINSVAGGGSLVSFPVLLAVGYPSVTANVTNTVGIWPGYASGTSTFRPELVGQGPRFRSFAVSAACGGVVGATLLLLLPSRVFREVVPWLVLLSSVLLAIQPRLAKRLQRNRAAGTEHHSVVVHVLVFVASIYGAYFGGGLGVVLLAILGLFVTERLQRLNALKTALSLVINTVALVAFVMFGPIAWTALVFLMPGSLVGGTAGARVVRKLPVRGLRAAVVLLGVGVAIGLLLK